jgi:hypothetical protein
VLGSLKNEIPAKMAEAKERLRRRTTAAAPRSDRGSVRRGDVHKKPLQEASRSATEPRKFRTDLNQVVDLTCIYF